MLRRFRAGTLEKIAIVFGCDVDIVSRKLECNGKHRAINAQKQHLSERWSNLQLLKQV